MFLVTGNTRPRCTLLRYFSYWECFVYIKNFLFSCLILNLCIYFSFVYKLVNKLTRNVFFASKIYILVKKYEKKNLLYSHKNP